LSPLTQDSPPVTIVETAPHAFPPLRLKRNEERRLRAGHLWVYSNEVDVAQTPLTEFEPGQAVEIQTGRGKALGTGYVNPHSLICARLLSRDPHHPASGSLIVHRLNVALALRERLYGTPFYRLVHGESDGLPGLVVDRYGDVVVVQMGTQGMERLKAEIIAAVHKVLRPRAVLLRNDAAARDLEGLPHYVETALGEVPPEVAIEENGARFLVDVHQGQKTGWFFDQRENRARARRYVADRRVLDLFSYTGGFGVQAALAGAREVICVDSSDAALVRAARNAELNGVADRVRTQRGDAFDILRDLRSAHERFDVVLVDPPALIPRKKDLREGETAYRRLNQGAMQVLTKDGILVTSSCSYHLEREVLQRIVGQSARHVDRSAQILEHGYQAPDHPMHPAIAETAYLKTVFARVVLG
jgi:23S rRNA (cytosine1962-C5)-methyltransferase